MRYAPKFLGPWERIDRMIEDRAAEALAESKRKFAEALAEIDRMLPKKLWWDTANYWELQDRIFQDGIRSQQNIAIAQQAGMQNMPNVIGWAGLALSATDFRMNFKNSNLAVK